MVLEYALLADSAKIRDNLLYVIAGGVSHVALSSLPGPLNASLAVKFKGSRAEIARLHRLEVRFVDDDGHPIPELQSLDFQFMPPEPTESEGDINFVIELQSVLIHRSGSMMIDILLDGQSYKRLSLTIAGPDRRVA